MLVSVIIPVYNMEKYLEKCFQSVGEQTYQNLEIVLVDDGSTDLSSSIICDRFAANDRRVRVIHKKNGGLSSARNAGIEIAKGDSIFFLDSDDYISTHCIQRCVELLQDEKADISIVSMVNVAESMNDEIANPEPVKTEVLNPAQAIEELFYQRKYNCGAPGKLYKRSALGDIRFPVGFLHEDLATCHLFFHNAGRIVYTNEYGYFYRQRQDSTMHVFNPDRMIALQWMKEIEDFCREKYPSLLPAKEVRSFNLAVHMLLDLPEDDALYREYNPVLWDEIKRTRNAVLQNRNVRMREKAAAVLSYFGEGTLRKAWNSRFAVKNKVYE